MGTEIVTEESEENVTTLMVPEGWSITALAASTIMKQVITKAPEGNNLTIEKTSLAKKECFKEKTRTICMRDLKKVQAEIEIL